MSEQSPRQRLEERSQHLSHVLSQRQVLLDRIGTGGVKLGSSWEATIKIGKVRRHVRASLSLLQDALEEAQSELSAYSQADNFRNEVEKRRGQLAEIRALVEEGNLPSEMLSKYEAMYGQLLNQPATNEVLRRGLHYFEEQLPQISTAQKPATEQEIAFPLPNGETITGKAAEILRILSHRDGEPISSSEIANALWPGEQDEVIRARLSTAISKIRKKLQPTDLELIMITSPRARVQGEKGMYVLQKRPSERQHA